MTDLIKIPTYSRFRNLTDQVFQRWTVISYAGMRGRDHLWRCRCSCDGKVVDVLAHNLINGTSRSCGCYDREQASKRATTHGRSKTPEYHAWAKMISRCYDQNNKNFDDYGGRGIRVHPEWRHDFAAFFTHVGLRPSAKHELDRYPNNNGNYEPGNVRWAVRKQQCRNKRNNRLLTYNGETMCLSEWAERTGIKYCTILMRLNRGKSAEQALDKSTATFRCPVTGRLTHSPPPPSAEPSPSTAPTSADG